MIRRVSGYSRIIYSIPIMISSPFTDFPDHGLWQYRSFRWIYGLVCFSHMEYCTYKLHTKFPLWYLFKNYHSINKIMFISLCYRVMTLSPWKLGHYWFSFGCYCKVLMNHSKLLKQISNVNFTFHVMWKKMWWFDNYILEKENQHRN